jgi:Ca2+-binding EF-hand superfamily protein
MADEKKKKKKSKKDAASEDAAPAPEPEAAPEPVKKASTRSSQKQAARSGSNVFAMFSEKQVAEFKEGFQVMDADKDGIIGKNDLRATFDMVGRVASNDELEEYLADASGPLSFTMLLQMFGERMSGGGDSADDDDTVIAAFNAFDEGDGKANANDLRHALCQWGDKYTDKECDTIFGELPVDSFDKLDLQGVITMLTAAPAENEE